jgi:amidase
VLLDATAGPDIGDPYPAPTPTRPFALEVGANPGRLRIAYTSRTPEGVAAHPDCMAALDHAVALLTDLGHELVEADLPGMTPDVGQSIGTVFLATTDWIVRYWVDRLGREPTDSELEPLTRAYLERSRTITGGRFLQAVETCQRFGRTVARFLVGFDAWLTPTMSTLPLPIGEITSTNDDPWRAARKGGSTVGFAGVVANITGNPAMSVPMHWTGDDLPVGVHFLGRFGDEATLFRLAAQLEDAHPWEHHWPPVSAVPIVAGG